MLQRRLILLGSACLALGQLPARAALAAQEKPANYARRADVRAWARKAAAETGLSEASILKTLQKARFQASVKRLMQDPARTATKSPNNWLAHRARLLTPQFVSYGRRFCRTHQKSFLAAQKACGVPAAVIAAVIGVESHFARVMGNFRVLDVLATLSFDDERRAAFFQQELACFLQWCARDNLNPAAVKGSFAGAVGMCQFMPSSILRCGTDGDADGRVRLRTSVPDAAASVGRYLQSEGWDAALPVALECTVNEPAARALETGGIDPETTLEAARKSGVQVEAPKEMSGQTPVLLVRLASPSRTLWRLGTQNFSALLHYNRSYFYAESVRELAWHLKEGFGAPPSAKAQRKGSGAA